MLVPGKAVMIKLLDMISVDLIGRQASPEVVPFLVDVNLVGLTKVIGSRQTGKTSPD